MSVFLSSSRRLGLAVVWLLVLGLAPALSDEQPPTPAPDAAKGTAAVKIPRPMLDITKMVRIEKPVEKLLKDASAAAPSQQPPTQEAKPAPARVDRTKSDVIERPAATLAARSASPPGGDFVNPKVEPGKVHWHANFQAACAAASRSGKPVLLFQMMGKLDDQFC